MTSPRLSPFPRRRIAPFLATALAALMIAACGSGAETAIASSGAVAATATPIVETAPIEMPANESAADSLPTDSAIEEPESTPTDSATDEPAQSPASSAADAAAAQSSTFVAEVWADNWFALWVNGELIGEDSVPITTERSFNAETITFEASYPLTIAVEAKDFKETDSGLEYIGEPNQQMGDGGIIVQITDMATGEVVAVSDGSWSALVVHRAPLNVECENSIDPDSECQFEILETPADWAEPSFDTTTWSRATVWSAAQVSPKDGYNEIAWNAAAELIWGVDLEVDNTVLLRTTVASPTE